MEGAMKDDRFKHILKDPRFRRIPKNVSKIKVDKRFKNMFNEKRFKNNSKLDERGRSLNLVSNENLKNLYNATDSSEESDDNSNEDKISSAARLGKKLKPPKKEKKKSAEVELRAKHESDESNSDGCDSDEEKEPDVKKKNEESNLKLQTELQESSDEESSESSDDADAVSSSSESESSESSEEVKDTDFDHHWEELQADAPDTDEISNRLAVCNMDWDRLRAEDLYAVLDSFKPPDSSILSVKIYPSEYGLKRMEEEKLKGPAELVEETLKPGTIEVEEKKTSKYHREKLRQYQMNRLRYYYGVVECDTAKTANTLYEQLNGMEYESSSVRFDLRFIPDDVTFDQEPKSSVDKKSDQSEYTPRMFVTTALQQVKVNLTWDETDPRRRETLQKAFTEPADIERDIKEYLASSSEDSEGEGDEENEAVTGGSTEDRIAKYKALLQSLEENEKKNEEEFEMEVTWNPDLKEKTEQIVKEKQEETSNPFEEKLKKMKEGKKLKKQQKKAEKNKKSESGSESGESDSSDGESGTTNKKQTQETKEMNELYLFADSKKPQEKSEKGRKGKKKQKKQAKQVEDFKCDVADPRFSAIYTSHEYNIDPSDPHFKKTEGTLAIITEKQKRLQTDLPHDKKGKKSKHY